MKTSEEIKKDYAKLLTRKKNLEEELQTINALLKQLREKLYEEKFKEYYEEKGEKK